MSTRFKEVYLYDELLKSIFSLKKKSLKTHMPACRIQCNKLFVHVYFVKHHSIVKDAQMSETLSYSAELMI